MTLERFKFLDLFMIVASGMIVAKFGLPQGPVGFIIYTLPVSDIDWHHIVSYCVHADDVQLYILFDPNIPGELDKGSIIIAKLHL